MKISKRKKKEKNKNQEKRKAHNKANEAGRKETHEKEKLTQKRLCNIRKTNGKETKK